MQNRSFRYGDGVFETIKAYKAKILLEQFHYDRLFLSLKMLQIENTLQASTLSQLILELCKKNNCTDLARVRLSVFRNDENKTAFAIEAFSLPSEINQWNKKGLTIDLYPYARKHPDAFSNLKTANFLPYVLAELFAKERSIDDAIVLNAFNQLADSSKANIFLIRKNEIFTPALHQGCISGVIRRFLLDELKKNNYRIHQEEISEQDLLDADEVFLTNSIYDMRWVQRFRDKHYQCKQSFLIYQKIILPLY
jgi:branched-chain amino acid aminotransferase